MANTVFACTAIYVGKDASNDGTILVARSNDCADVFAARLKIYPRVENEPGRTLPVDISGTVTAQLPETTYKYSGTPMMDSTLTFSGTGRDDAVCINENGVAMTMSITSFSNKAAMEADPWVETGISEFTADQLVISQSGTAREAVDTICHLIDEYGSSETNIAIITDQDEAWYVEMYTGHQYAAVKLPDDKVCVFGNEFNLEYLSDYEESITSPELETLAVENGFAVYGDNGELNLWATYSGPEVVEEYSHMRTWIGHKTLAPDSYGDYDHDEMYPLTFTAQEKVSLLQVMELIRNRYEGTEYCPDTTGRIDMRVIGTDTALSVHIIQLDPAMPAEAAGTTWVSLGPAVYGVFVPMNILCTEPSASYAASQPAEMAKQFEADVYPYFAFKELNTLCMMDYRTYGTPVRAYWHEAETQMIDGMDAMRRHISEELAADPEKAQEEMTQYCAGLQEKAFADAKILLNEVRWYTSKNSNTMKLGKNPETGEYLTSERVLDPIEVTLDGSFYGEKQDHSQDPD